MSNYVLTIIALNAQSSHPIILSILKIVRLVHLFSWSVTWLSFKNCLTCLFVNAMGSKSQTREELQQYSKSRFRCSVVDTSKYTVWGSGNERSIKLFWNVSL